MIDETKQKVEHIAKQQALAYNLDSEQLTQQLTKMADWGEQHGFSLTDGATDNAGAPILLMTFGEFVLDTDGEIWMLTWPKGEVQGGGGADSLAAYWDRRNELVRRLQMLNKWRAEIERVRPHAIVIPEALRTLINELEREIR